jgi:hypothetical protein
VLSTLLATLHNVEALLSEHPAMGLPDRVQGTRELVIPDTPFIVPYRVQGGTIQVCAFFTLRTVSPRHFKFSRDWLTIPLCRTHHRELPGLEIGAIVVVVCSAKLAFADLPIVRTVKSSQATGALRDTHAISE